MATAAEESRKWRASQAADYLDLVRGMGMRVKSLRFAIEDLSQAASGVKGVDYSRPMVAAPASPDAIPDAVAEIMGLVDEMRAMREAYRSEIAAVERALNRMGDSSAAAIIEMHYIAGRTWAECAEVFHYSKPGMMGARQRALCAFYEVMPPSRMVEVPKAI